MTVLPGALCMPLLRFVAAFTLTSLHGSLCLDRGLTVGVGSAWAEDEFDNEDCVREIRPEFTLYIDSKTLDRVLAGDVFLVDNLGRVIELEVRGCDENDVVVGRPQVSINQKRLGPIDTENTVTLGEVVPGRKLIVEQRRLFELRVNADSNDIERLLAVPVINDLIQVGRDLTPDAEADLISKGWQ